MKFSYLLFWKLPLWPQYVFFFFCLNLVNDQWPNKRILFGNGVKSLFLDLIQCSWLFKHATVAQLRYSRIQMGLYVLFVIWLYGYYRFYIKFSNANHLCHSHYDSMWLDITTIYYSWYDDIAWLLKTMRMTKLWFFPSFLFGRLSGMEWLCKSTFLNWI